MADFIVPDREELEEVLAALGIGESFPEFEAALVMLAARPAGGEVWKIKAITKLPEATIELYKAAMIREAVWPGLDSWLGDNSDADFSLDLFAVVGKLRRIVYGNGDVKYIDSRVPQTDCG